MVFSGASIIEEIMMGGTRAFIVALDTSVSH